MYLFTECTVYCKIHFGKIRVNYVVVYHQSRLSHGLWIYLLKIFS